MSPIDHYVIDSVLQSLDEAPRDQLAESLNQFFHTLYSQRKNPDQTEKTISQISNYLRKKSYELMYENTDQNQIYNLRKLRNEIAHGRPRRDIDWSEYYPVIWRAISKLGNHYGSNDIENLISYTLHAPNKGLASTGQPPAKIASTYKRIFDSMSAQEKQMVFTELLLRLFSDPEAMVFLEEKYHK